jgi:RNA polymerase sigma-70 factor (ECF subfamily)
LAYDQEDIDSIITGCRAGNRRAQEQLYRNYYRVMMNICVRYTRNEADAVEVLNNAFLKVFKHIQRYEPAQASLYTWIRTVVINSCLDFIKSKQRVEGAKELTETVDVHIPAEAISKIRAAELLALVRRLPPATQAVFNLYVVEGYNHREISGMLNISEGTSKWHLSEGRKQLQQMLQTQGVTINE